jgi:predicted GNAT family N-acyltransferase
MAVSQSLRGQGIGKQVLTALLEHARQEGHRELVLHAQTHAVPFYEQQGFIVEGEEFIEADMPHLLMRRRLG